MNDEKEKSNQQLLSEIQYNIFRPYADYLDLNGNLKSLDIFFHNQSPNYKNERFEFDKNKNILNYFINYDPITGKSSLEEEFSYDSLNRVIFSKRKQINGISKDTMTEIKEYSYSNNKIIWSHDKNGTISRFETMGRIEGEIFIYETYDSSGTKYSSVYFDKNKNKIYSQHGTVEVQYKFDNYDRIIERTKFVDNQVITSDLYEYRGKEKTHYKVTSSLYEAKPEIEIIKYEFDELNNWIVRISDAKTNIQKGENIVTCRIKYRK